MKKAKHNAIIRQASKVANICFIGATTMLILGTSGAAAQTGTGAMYGSRDPHTCASRTEPASGKPSAGQLTEYFLCDVEVTDAGFNLNLYTDVHIEVGGSRPFNPGTDVFADIDSSLPVYPVRGSYTWWQCGRLDRVPNQPGANCARRITPQASGICFKSTFAEWHCKMYGGSSDNIMTKYPAPTGN